MKKIISSITAVAVTIITVSIIAESAFRIYGLFDKNKGLKNSIGDINKKYCHSFKPNNRFRLVASKNSEYNVGVLINNYGFRGKDIETAKKPGTVRIMAIGDSFTFGVGAAEDETIPFLIEKDLRNKGIAAEVINAGFGSYSPILHYLRVRDEYLEFNPDLVLLFFDFSDLADDWRGEQNAIKNASGKILRCDPEYVNGKRDWWITLRAHSRLCAYINNKIIRTIDKIRALGFKNYIKAKLEGKRAKALIIEKEIQDKNINPIKYDGYLMIRGRDKLSCINEHFKRNEKYLNLIRGLLAERGISMMLVIYPYGIHVGPNQWGTGREYWGFEKGRLYDDYYAFDILEDYAKRNNVACINLLPDFLKNSDKHLFFDIDGHFTPEANKIAARSIIDSDAFTKILNSVER